MQKNIAVIKGDGIGPEIVDEAIKVLKKAAEVYSHVFNFKEALMGGFAVDSCGTPLPKETVDICKQSDSVLLGAVGGQKWDSLPSELRPEKGLLGIRKALGLYVNLRPATVHYALRDASPLKSSVIGEKLDLVIVRELTGGIYFGKRGHLLANGVETAFDTEEYSEKEIRRIADKAFELARLRRKKVTSVDKANVLETSRLWRKIMHEYSKKNQDIEYNDMLVDNAAMQLVKNPSQFDVLVTSNMFGDILSDEASMITGSIGMIPSASLGDESFGLYEPIHGSAPDIAGKNIANPMATILSAAMMLRISFGLLEEADAIENAVEKALSQNYRTNDIKSGASGEVILTTSEMGDKIAEFIE